MPSWFVMIWHCDVSQANGNANAFSLPFLASNPLDASGCMQSRGGWWTFARRSVFIISIGRKFVTPYTRSYICLNDLSWASMDPRDDSLSGQNPKHTRRCPSLAKTRSLGDIRCQARAVSGSRSWPWPHGNMARRNRVEAHYQRVVEARAPEAATRGSFGHLKSHISDRTFEHIWTI